MDRGDESTLLPTRESSINVPWRIEERNHLGSDDSPAPASSDPQRAGPSKSNFHIEALPFVIIGSCGFILLDREANAP